MEDSRRRKGDETQINDLEAFEEWEEEGSEETQRESEQGSSPAPDEQEDLPDEVTGEEQDEGLDLADFERMEQDSGASEEALSAEEEISEAVAGLAPDVPVNVVAVIGKATTNVGELMKLKLGHVVELGRPPGETVDVVANGRLIARGELVDIDGQLGVRILKIVK